MTRDVLYILADGAHARFVERSPTSGDFVTLREIDGSQALDTLREELGGGSPQGRSQESLSPARRGVGPADTDYERRAKESFVRDVAHEAAKAAAGRRGVVLVAPPRLIGSLREAIGEGVRIEGELHKDLIKTPDHDLADHLSGL
ncbi:MAG TPA: host attachment protein [Caulobacteraceae bacterium]|nr:host attachment protein [Caulobacteraceae bacterium]